MNDNIFYTRLLEMGIELEMLKTEVKDLKEQNLKLTNDLKSLQWRLKIKQMPLTQMNKNLNSLNRKLY